jgi:hypothetical protein
MFLLPHSFVYNEGVFSMHLVIRGNELRARLFPLVLWVG